MATLALKMATLAIRMATLALKMATLAIRMATLRPRWQHLHSRWQPFPFPLPPFRRIPLESVLLQKSRRNVVASVVGGMTDKVRGYLDQLTGEQVGQQCDPGPGAKSEQTYPTGLLCTFVQIQLLNVWRNGSFGRPHKCQVSLKKSPVGYAIKFRAFSTLFFGEKTVFFLVRSSKFFLVNFCNMCKKSSEQERKVKVKVTSKVKGLRRLYDLDMELFGYSEKDY